jgi:hypothetical protein
MDTGDVVRHTPSGERWLVAYVHRDYVCCCGWPESLAPVADCVLLESATPEQRLILLRQMAAMEGSDSRKSYAKRRLEAAHEVLPKEQ